ncbi:MAG: hypothetical protein N5P05_001384 [Chroococcopsis gigantea SAG 12.99]|jgi:hypothetical protein|nr:type V CRISPR-associated protein Cas12k [Chlorogloea purpurea SAG 13.99]MDV2999778.1 hypothetical protein [Chroococcopsis gigantea SAG 12.99]
MTTKTIECRLHAQTGTLRYLWEMMAGKNTPLINELLSRINQHPDFEEWFKAGSIPKKAMNSICDDLKKQEAYSGQPGRFYTSTMFLVDYMLKSWFEIQQSLQKKLEGKQRWLKMLKNDRELEEQCQRSIEEIRSAAWQILQAMQQEDTDNSPKKSTRKKDKKNKQESVSLFDRLFQAYNDEQDELRSCALAYLLKNNCEITEEDEDLQRYNQRRRRKEIEIERLQKQLENRFPIGRDLTGQQWLEILTTVRENIPKDDIEISVWRAKLLKKAHKIPYPILYESNSDLTWSKKDGKKLQVRFNGLVESLKALGLEPNFEIRCDERQLPWFNRFYEDYQLWLDSGGQLSMGLFALRSARLLWRSGEGKGEPWLVNHLYLQCSIDTRLGTKEGTEQVRQEKVAQLEINLVKMKPEMTFPIFFRSRSLSIYFSIWKTIAEGYIAKFVEKGDFDKTRKNFSEAIKRNETTLKNMELCPPRPQKPVYKGNPDIIAGVSMGLDQPATVAIVNVITGEVITERSLRQLLGKNYRLLQRQRRQKQALSHQRHKAQKKDAPNQYGESELGLYVDHLIAKAIVKLAVDFCAHSIAVPNLERMREIIESEVRARAQQKILGYKEGQKKYAQQYRSSVHQWSYNRLSECIYQAAASVNIEIEKVFQSLSGSPFSKAKTNAIGAYTARLKGSS